MLRNFTNEEWERFLKQSSDQFRMQPSNKVWRNISRNLHRRRRRVVVASTALLLTVCSLGYFLIPSSENRVPPAVVQPDAPAKQVIEAPRSEITQADQSTTQQQTAFTKPRTYTPEHSTNGTAKKEIADTEKAPENDELLSRTVALLDNIPLLTGNVASYAPIDYLPNNNLPTLKSSNELKEPSSTGNTPAPTRLTANKRRLNFQLFFTPTISYRKLSENNAISGAASLQNSSPFTINRACNINNAVTHKPSIGLELGFAAKYAVTKDVKLRGGVQFNISRYGIKAFNYPYEMATITLSNGCHMDSLSTVSNLRNFNGTEPNWIQNFYFQVSAPVGVEFKLAGNDNMQLGIASTLQPTYILGDKAYLLSNDYKNYAQVPGLIRRWNMAANVETFVAYSTGKINWQVGPQVRYQLLSSYSKKYPVKENLFDFGLKVGVSLNKV